MILSVLITVLVSGGVPDQRHPAGQDCRGDRRVECWAAERGPRVRELFGSKAIEDHARAGAQVRRAFYVDGYNRDVVAIEFVRTPGADPTLIVRFPDAGGGHPRQPLTAPVRLADWDELIEVSRHFDRTLVKIPEKTKPGDIVICVHPWAYTVEAVDPAEQDAGAQVRHRSEDGCDYGLAQAFAIYLYKLAASLIPPCDLLNRSDYRNEAELLSSCGVLKGDRLAAATVMNAMEPLRRVRDEKDASRAAGLFDYKAKIDWAGESYSGNQAPEFWGKKASEGRATRLVVNSVIGESATRVQLRGLLSRYVEDSVYEEADVEQRWVLDGRRAQIHEATVGPFKRVKR